MLSRQGKTHLRSGVYQDHPSSGIVHGSSVMSVQPRRVYGQTPCSSPQTGGS